MRSTGFRTEDRPGRSRSLSRCRLPQTRARGASEDMTATSPHERSAYTDRTGGGPRGPDQPERSTPHRMRAVDQVRTKRTYVPTRQTIVRITGCRTIVCNLVTNVRGGVLRAAAAAQRCAHAHRPGGWPVPRPAPHALPAARLRAHRPASRLRPRLPGRRRARRGERCPRTGAVREPGRAPEPAGWGFVPVGRRPGVLRSASGRCRGRPRSSRWAGSPGTRLSAASGVPAKPGPARRCSRTAWGGHRSTGSDRSGFRSLTTFLTTRTFDAAPARPRTIVRGVAFTERAKVTSRRAGRRRHRVRCTATGWRCSPAPPGRHRGRSRRSAPGHRGCLRVRRSPPRSRCRSR